jgi:kynurenine formamidase
MPVRRVIDLSMPLDERTPFYRGDPESRICAAQTIAADGFNVSRLELGSHSGTHCDAPFHFREDGARIDELPFERFLGRGVVVDVTGLAPRTAIGWDRLAPYAAALGPGVIVLLRTGWDAHRETAVCFEHPSLDGDGCARLLDAGVRAIGIDALNLDETLAGDVALERFCCHAQISDAGGVIVENLVGVKAIDFPDPFVSVLPIRIAGGDGAPARAVAIGGLD